MNPTRTEWIRMWEAITKIESIVKRTRSQFLGKPELFKEVTFIKDQIQGIIGPME